MDNKNIYLDLQQSNNNFNEESSILNLKDSDVGSIIIYNPFNKDITTKDSQLINLKFFSNINNYNLIKIFNRILILSYLLFIAYFTINFIITKEPDTDLIFFKVTSTVIIISFLYNIWGFKLRITKDFIKFKNKTLYFKEIRKIDSDREYKFIEIYIKGEFRKNKLDSIYPDVTIYFDNKYRTKAIEDYWEKYKSKEMEVKLHNLKL